MVGRTSRRGIPLSSETHPWMGERNSCLEYKVSKQERFLGEMSLDTKRVMHVLRNSTLCYAKSLQSCPTPSDPMDCSPPGSSIHGIFQARVLEWGAVAFSVRNSGS